MVQNMNSIGSKPSPAPVSVVIPCYRSADTVIEAVASVDAQTSRPREVILVDDCSGDDTPAKLHALSMQYPEGWVRVEILPENSGPSRARNAGWNMATQPYVAFLDSDDTWFPEKIAMQLSVMEKHPDMAMLAHPMQLAERGETAPATQWPPRFHRIGRVRLMFNNPFQTSTVLLKRDLPFRFDERFRRVEDFMLWAQILYSGHACGKLEQPLAMLHKHPFGAGGLSGDLRAMHIAGRQVRNELRRQGLVSWPEHYLTRCIAEVRKVRHRAVLALRRHRARQANA